MAITQTETTSFKVSLLNGEMDFSSDTTHVFKIALYTNVANLDATTTVYSATNEVASGAGYTSGGKTLTIAQNPTSTSTIAWMDFDDPIWSAATITARGALIYKFDGVTNPSVCVLDFGADKATIGGDFEVNFPIANSSTAIIKLT